MAHESAERLMGVCGLDPGLSGGVTILYPGLTLMHPMQTKNDMIDMEWLRFWLTDNAKYVDVCYVELIQAIFKTGKSAMFSMGRYFGQIEATVTALNIPIKYVRPQAWQKHFGFQKVEGATPSERKQRNVQKALELYPQLDFLASKRSKVPHLGLVDATLIAHYGQDMELRLQP